MTDQFYYICDAKRKINDGVCTGESCKYLNDGECERTKDIQYAKNEFNRKNFEFVCHQTQGDIDIYSEKNEKGECI